MPSAGGPGMLKTMPLRVLVADDNVEFLQAACSLLEREGLTVVGRARTGAEAIRRAADHDPDVILLDIGLGDDNGFDVAERLRRRAGTRARVILISARPEEDFGDLVEASPAIGFLPKAALSASAVIGLLGPS
jgi:CheY-like chemotaxis protein